MNKLHPLVALCAALFLAFNATAADNDARPGAAGLADVYSRPLSVVEQGSMTPPPRPYTEVDASGVAEITHYNRRKGGVTETAVKSLDSQIVAAFPRESVSTVGDAARYLVGRAGYTLQTGSLSKDAHRTLAAKLPAAQRTMGPDQVRMLLLEVVGPGIEPVVDKSTKTVTLVARPDAKVQGAPDPSLTNALPSVSR